jgi:hypothetical protein
MVRVLITVWVGRRRHRPIPDIQTAAHKCLRRKRVGWIPGKEIFDQRRFPELDALKPRVACRGQHQIMLRLVAPVVHDFEGKLAHDSNCQEDFGSGTKGALFGLR